MEEGRECLSLKAPHIEGGNQPHRVCIEGSRGVEAERRPQRKGIPPPSGKRKGRRPLRNEKTVGQSRAGGASSLSKNMPETP